MIYAIVFAEIFCQKKRELGVVVITPNQNAVTFSCVVLSRK